MRREIAQNIKIDFSVELKEGDNVFAFCSTCKKTVFVGEDRTQAGHKVLRERILEHFAWYGEDHAVDVIYPDRNNKLVDGMVHISTGAKITAIEGIKRQFRST